MMIVRNETATLPRLAASLRGIIDRWTIVDTGSTDDTVGVARMLFADLPGEIISRTWDGFGPARNIALDRAGHHTDWLLSMDADDTLCGHLDLAQLGGADGIEVELHHSVLRYWVPRLVRADAGWHWHGRVHEYLALPGAGRLVRSAAWWVHHHGDGGSRAGRLVRDVAMLERDWSEMPGDPRTAFYLGRSYDDLARAGEAAAWYRRRLELGGWDEEDWYARYRLGVCLLSSSGAEGCGELWHAWGERPWRPEPLVALAEYYRGAGLWALAWQACRARRPGPPDGLFLDLSAEWRLDYEASITAWHVGERSQGGDLTAALLARDDLPAGVRQTVATNARWYT
jgi:glycosyltransferase involved in cell wall biosynthesis